MNSIFDALITKKIARGSGGSFVPTESQLNAMNSGITASDVQQIDENKTNKKTKSRKNSGHSDYDEGKLKSLKQTNYKSKKSVSLKN